MKKTINKLFSFLIAVSMIMSLTGMSVVAETNETKSFYPEGYYTWSTKGYQLEGYCWLDGNLELVLPCNVGDLQTIRVKKVTLDMTIVQNSGWKEYNPETTYTGDIYCLYNNDWNSEISYADLTANVSESEKLTVASENSIISADVTDSFKKGLDNGKISYIIKKNSESPKFVFNRSNKSIKLTVTYYSDDEYVSVLNSATEDNIDEIINSFENGYVSLYNGLVHKEYIIDTLLGRTDYESVEDFIETFETAYLDYMADPEPEDAKGKIVTYNFTDYARGYTNDNKGLRWEYANLGAYGIERVLIKFNVGNINKDFIKRVTLKYRIKSSLSSWFTYDPTEDTTTIVDSISSEWKSSPITMADADLPELSKNENTIKKEGFIEKTGVAVTYKAVEYGTYAQLAADVTKDFVAREISDGNVSYMLRKAENPNYVVGDDGEYVLEVEYLNDTEVIEKINSVESADEINAILTSGLFNDSVTYKKYSELNNNTLILDELFESIPYDSMESFNTAFVDAYEAYIENPSEEDEAGEVYTISAELTGSHDGTNAITNLTCYGNQYDVRALIRTDISEIDPRYVRAVRLVYPLTGSYGGFWNYSTDADYKGTVQHVINGWKYGDTWQVHRDESFFIDKNVATIQNSGTRTMKADVTENLLAWREKGETKISYLIRKNDINTPAAYFDSKSFVGLEVELLNDYEKLQLINSAETAEEIGEILASGLFEGDEYQKYAELNNKSVVNETVIGDYENLDAFYQALTNACDEYLKNPSYEDKAGLTKAISYIEYGRTDVSQKKELVTEYVSIGSYGTERALIKFNISDINREYVKKATLTYKLKDKFSNWYTYDPETDYTAEVLGISSNWTAITTTHEGEVPENAKYANTVGAEGFTENDAVATSYKKIENTTYAVMAADITDDFKSRKVTDDNISYMLQRKQGNGSCVINTESAYTIEIEYLNEYELLEKYKTVKDDVAALTDYISEIVKIEEISGITPSIASIFILGRDFTSYVDLLDTIEDAGEGGNMAVVDENITVAETVAGTFTVKNFIEGEETNTFYAVVASYTADNEMIESYIVDIDGEPIEIDQMYYDEEKEEFVVGESDELSFTLTQNTGDIASVKVFLWDGFGTMKPYSDAKVIYTK